MNKPAITPWHVAYNTWHKGSGMFFHPDNGFLYLTNGNDNISRVTTSGTVSVNVMPLKLDFTGFAASGEPKLRTQFPAGRNYIISYTDDLETWHPLHTSTANGLVLAVQDPAAGTTRFYRLLVEP